MCRIRHGLIHTNRQSEISKYDPLDQDLGSQLQTALQRHHRPLIFMVPTGWQCQGRATVGKVSKFEC
jgi:hypothetical protein